MSWNYRVIFRQHEEDYVLQVHEVYYDDDGKITLWSEKPVAASSGESVSDLKRMPKRNSF